MTDMDSSTLVATIRAKRGQTQEELARELGVSFTTVNAWERGRSEPRRTARMQLEEMLASLEVTSPLRIVAIDDDPIGLAVIEGLLAATGRDLEVSTASDGVDGLLVAGAARPDLVLLDVMMPGLDGFQVAERIARTPGLEHTTVVLVTANPSSQVLARAEGAPVLRVLAKPVEEQQLIEVLDEVERHRGHAATP